MRDLKTLIVEGGASLNGTIEIGSNKNAILPGLIASLLTDETCMYSDVPTSPDVLYVLQALEELGASIVKHNRESSIYIDVEITCNNIRHTKVSDCVQGVQSAYLFIGPLLARFGECTLPKPLGCKLGYRGYESHLAYLHFFGVKVEEIENGRLLFTVPKKKEPKLVQTASIIEKVPPFAEAAVTATENLLMFLSHYSEEDTRVYGIAEEPHVQDLIQFLHGMGSDIRGIGNARTIRGNYKLHGGTFVCGPDHVEFFGAAVLALMTKSDLTLHVERESLHLHHMVSFLMQFGAEVAISDDGKGGADYLVHGKKFAWKPTDDFAKASEFRWKLAPRPWHGFPVDCLPAALALSTTNRDPRTSFLGMNWMYEHGLEYVPCMQEMGASVLHLDSITAVFGGTSHNPFTTSRTVTAPSVIEGVRALILCGLSAEKGVVTTIKNAEPIFRRNPYIVDQLQKLGASVQVV